jgi:hypothetical protein
VAAIADDTTRAEATGGTTGRGSNVLSAAKSVGVPNRSAFLVAPANTHLPCDARVVSLDAAMTGTDDRSGPGDRITGMVLEIATRLPQPDHNGSLRRLSKLV